MNSLFLLLALSLSQLFTDHGVLQQKTQAPVWGWGTPGAKVEVTGTWNNKTVQTKVAPDGSWRVLLPTGRADGISYSLKVQSGKETLVVEDVVLGEVWVCSGQSNMEMPVGGFGFQEVEGAREAILDAPGTARELRVFDIKTGKCTAPIKDVEAVWAYSTPAVTARTSAVAYFFGKRLAKALGVPVGIIVNAWGGSRIEPWMTREAIDASGISAQERAAIDAIEENPYRWPETPELIWNGRVKPIAGYAAKGFLWYQGCSNLGQNCYDKLQTAMVKLWRESWGRGEMPFIFALLAPHGYDNPDQRTRPFFVETQMRALKTTPNAYAVSLETIGDKITIHPAKKQEVADMMFLRAYTSVYGQDAGFPVDYPEPASMEFLPDGRVKILLTNVWSNLMSITAREIVGFELAGEERQFQLADAQVDWDGNTIYVSCPEVPRPVAVRYGFRNWMGANLQTSLGIPVPPFRSDDWSE